MYFLGFGQSFALPVTVQRKVQVGGLDFYIKQDRRFNRFKMYNYLMVKLFCIFQACQLPLFEYLVEKMCSLCYDRAWYAKFGG